MTDLRIERDEPSLTTLTLQRAHKRNALSCFLMEVLARAVEETKTRLLILRAEKPVFSAGLDLKEAIDPKLIERSAELYAQCLRTLTSFSGITIAVVEGSALAGGAGLALACDFVIATEESSFAFPEVHRGLVPAQVMTLLAHQVSPRALSTLVFTGEPIGARHAEEVGLINQAVAAQDLESALTALSTSLLKAAPEALAHTKKWRNTLLSARFSEEFAEALALHTKARRSREAQQRIEAFLQQKRY